MVSSPTSLTGRKYGATDVSFEGEKKVRRNDSI